MSCNVMGEEPEGECLVPGCKLSNGYVDRIAHYIYIVVNLDMGGLLYRLLALC